MSKSIEREDSTAVAIVGMGCRFPGASDPDAFWRLLRDGADALVEHAEERMPHRFQDPAWAHDPTRLHGGFLEHVGAFDAEAFGIAHAQAAQMDPQHQMLLEVAWEALDDAGAPSQPNTGVFIALARSDHEGSRGALSAEPDLQRFIGGARSSAAAHIADRFGFTGPALVVDTDRSSSLVAIHLACQSLLLGDAKQAVVGAANAILDPAMGTALERAGLLSPSGKCQFGSSAADGLVRSEGVAVVVLKPLRDALSARDRIYAVIRGSAVHHEGGRSGDLLRPSAAALSALVSRACERAGMSPAELDYIEAHGTGTVVGDQVELVAFNALQAQREEGQEPCLVGSVKTNIGHTEGAAGLAGLVKAALALWHREWPGNRRPAPADARSSLDDAARLRIAYESKPFGERLAPARAGVNAVGVNGTLAHVILEEPAGLNAHSPASSAFGRHLFTLSAPSSEALRGRARQLASWLEAEPSSVNTAALCATQAVRRRHLTHRLAGVVRTLSDVRHLLAAGTRREPADPLDSRYVFVFSGDGTQWVGMGRRLLSSEPAFRSAFEQADEVVRKCLGASLLQALEQPQEAWQLCSPRLRVPALVAIQVSLAALWSSWGVRPHAVLGVKLGEIAAAHCAGTLTLEHAMELACRYAQAMSASAHSQRGLQIDASVAVARRALDAFGTEIQIVGIADAETTLVTGSTQVLERLRKHLAEQSIPCSEQALEDAVLEVSALDSAIGPELRSIGLSGASLPSYSSALVDSADDWARRLTAPSDVPALLARVLDAGYRTFIELSPHPKLVPALARAAALRELKVDTFASLEALQDDEESMLSSLAGLYMSGHALDFSARYAAHPHTLQPPAYPWNRRQYWYTLPAVANTPAPARSTATVEKPAASHTPALTPTERRQSLTRLVEDVLCAVHERPIVLNHRQSLREQGFSSFMLLDARGRIEQQLGTSLAPTLLIDYPNVEAVVERLLARKAGNGVEHAKPHTGVNGRSSNSPGLRGAPDAPAATPPRPEPAPVAAERIAIIGMACRLPGGADDLEAFWSLLSRGRSAVTEVPATRWPADAFFDTDPLAPGKSHSKWGAFIDRVDEFDPQFFGISPREAERMDPQQRLLLEVTWETLERAGYAPRALARARTGVFVGMSNTDDYAFLKRLRGHLTTTGLHDSTGDALSIAAGRLSYHLGLSGPSMVVDTACSSSLVALHLACQSLRSGETDLALAGGVSLILSPHAHIAYGKAKMLSPTGLCHTFDRAADGYVRGEGCGMVLLRPLSQAIAAGDNILAVVAGSAINQDGRSNGLTAPNVHAQEACLRAAYQAAGVAPADVDYVETHGTGTPLGDPIEIQALNAVLSEGRDAQRRFVLGALKSNIGHLEAAAGIAGLIKAVLALQHGEIPVNLNLETPNPFVDWENIPCQLPLAPVPWLGERRTAGVSAFGFSGTNAHVVLEAAPPVAARAEREAVPAHHILALSAATSEALSAQVARFAALLDTTCPTAHDLRDACFTANTGRNAFKHRLAVVGANADELRAQLVARAQSRPVAVAKRPKLAFLFTGQGSQYVGMGRELYETQPSFRRTLQHCASLLEGTLDRPLLEVIFGADDEAAALLHETTYTQPALFALEYALATFWRSLGVEPDAVMGHSLGELAAASFAGVISLDDGLKLAADRGRLTQRLAANGAMYAVNAASSQVEPLLEHERDSISIACINSPSNTVISGRKDRMHAVLERLAAEGIKTTELQVSFGSHSPLMDAVLEPFARRVAEVNFGMLRVPLISNLYGRSVTSEELRDPRYWTRHAREAVRFMEGFDQLVADGCRAFVEIGPHPVLLDLGSECRPELDPYKLPSLERSTPDGARILESLRGLYELGFDIHWDALYEGSAPRRVVLPTYPFQRARYWFEQSERREPNETLEPETASDSQVDNADVGQRIETPAALNDYGWSVSWQAQASSTFASSALSGRWLLLDEEPTGLSSVLAERMSDAGWAHAHIDPTAQALRDAAACGACAGLVLFVPTCSADEAGPAALRVCNSALGTLQAIVDAPWPGRAPRVWVVTRGAHDVVEREQACDAAAAALWGMVRVFYEEYPRHRGALIDFSVGSDQTVGNQLFEEISTAGSDPQIALRGQDRYVLRLSPLVAEKSFVQHSLDPDGNYLITGGLGGLGRQIAEMLAKRGAKYLTLVARHVSPVQAAPLQRHLQESYGTQCTVLAADVSLETDVAFVLGQIEQSVAPLRGVFHLAGVLDDGAIQSLDEARLANVMAPKVSGAWNLHLQTSALNLDQFVLFSSVAAVVGNRGQAHYAAANAFMDGLAHLRKQQGLPGLSINWGPWSGAGMATDGVRRQQLQDRFGVTPLESDEALRALDWALSAAPRQVMFAAVQPERNAGAATWFAREAPEPSAVPPAADVPERTPPLPPLLRELRSLPQTDRIQTLSKHVRSVTLDLLGLGPNEEIGPYQPLNELGLDSLMAIDIIRALESSLGSQLPTDLLLQAPSIEDIVEYIGAQVA